MTSAMQTAKHLPALCPLKFLGAETHGGFVIERPDGSGFFVNATKAETHMLAAAYDLLKIVETLTKATPKHGGMIRFDGDELADARAAILKAKGGAA